MSQPFPSTSQGSYNPHPPSQLRPNGMNRHHSSNGISSSLQPLSRPPPRIDIGRIKQDLHDALGEDGLPYWKALNGYLLGQIGRGEMEGMVREWLKGPKVELHNKFLLTLLHNASIPSHSLHSASSLSLRKRKRIDPEDPEFDTDETIIEPKSRVLHWASKILSTKDGNRAKRSWSKSLQIESEAPQDDPMWGQDRRKLGMQMQPGNTMPPLASTSRLLPSSQQLAHRLSQLAKGYELNIAPDAMSDIGEFLAVGMDAHLSDILHAHVHLFGKDRPGNRTIHIPPGVKKTDDDHHHPNCNSKPTETEGEVPGPTLDSLRDLLHLNPSLHANTSPALYRLSSGVTCAEAEYNAPPVKHDSGGISNGYTVGKSAKFEGGGVVKERKSERVQRYLDNGMIKVDAPKEDRKDKKHSLHWKYEDPALTLESVLG